MPHVCGRMMWAALRCMCCPVCSCCLCFTVHLGCTLSLLLSPWPWPGFVPTENLRFREESLTFKVAEQDTKEEEVKKFLRYQYPCMSKTLGNFSMSVEEGEFTDSEIIVMLGENGTGKTTFIRMLAGMLAPDEVSPPLSPRCTGSCSP